MIPRVLWTVNRRAIKQMLAEQQLCPPNVFRFMFLVTQNSEPEGPFYAIYRPLYMWNYYYYYYYSMEQSPS